MEQVRAGKQHQLSLLLLFAADSTSGLSAGGRGRDGGVPDAGGCRAAVSSTPWWVAAGALVTTGGRRSFVAATASIQRHQTYRTVAVSALNRLAHTPPSDDVNKAWIHTDKNQAFGALVAVW